MRLCWNERAWSRKLLHAPLKPLPGNSKTRVFYIFCICQRNLSIKHWPPIPECEGKCRCQCGSFWNAKCVCPLVMQRDVFLGTMYLSGQNLAKALGPGCHKVGSFPVSISCHLLLFFVYRACKFDSKICSKIQNRTSQHQVLYLDETQPFPKNRPWVKLCLCCWWMASHHWFQMKQDTYLHFSWAFCHRVPDRRVKSMYVAWWLTTWWGHV